MNEDLLKSTYRRFMGKMILNNLMIFLCSLVNGIVIYGFDDTDMLEITGKFTAAYDSSANIVAFNVDSTANAITLKDFTATSLNINDSFYKISGTKLVKK